MGRKIAGRLTALFLPTGASTLAGCFQGLQTDDLEGPGVHSTRGAATASGAAQSVVILGGSRQTLSPLRFVK